MNDQDFILLIEQYLDGSISAAGRKSLSDAVQADPERRRLFEAQARQHVRLHAQTSRVDFTESQRVAVMVMDVAEKEHPSHFIDTLKQQSVRAAASVRPGYALAPPQCRDHRVGGDLYETGNRLHVPQPGRRAHHRYDSPGVRARSPGEQTRAPGRQIAGRDYVRSGRRRRLEPEANANP